MSNSKKYLNAETIMGAIVFIVAFLFLLYAVQKTNFKNEFSNNVFIIYASFESADGLRTGSDVMLAGVKVGSVSDINLNKEQYTADTTLSLFDNYNIPEDSEAIIVSDGLLGEKYISLNIGGSAESLKHGDYFLYTQSSINIINLLNKFSSK